MSEPLRVQAVEVVAAQQFPPQPEDAPISFAWLDVAARRTKGVLGLRPSKPCARRLYQAAALP